MRKLILALAVGLSAILFGKKAKAKAPEPSTYTVQKGDTLSKIALRFYSLVEMWPILQDANKIADPDRIEIGQVLTIPNPASISREQIAEAASRHRVRYGV